jgi:hypothetical protein
MIIIRLINENSYMKLKRKFIKIRNWIQFSFYNSIKNLDFRTSQILNKKQIEIYLKNKEENLLINGLLIISNIFELIMIK